MAEEDKSLPLDTLVKDLQSKLNKQKLLIDKFKQQIQENKDFPEKMKAKDEELAALSAKVSEISKELESKKSKPIPDKKKKGKKPKKSPKSKGKKKPEDSKEGEELESKIGDSEVSPEEKPIGISQEDYQAKITEVTEKEFEISQLQEQLKEKDNTISGLMNQQNELQQKINELQAQIPACQALIQDLQQQLAAAMQAPVQRSDVDTGFYPKPSMLSQSSSAPPPSPGEKQCPQCGARGLEIKEFEDKTKVLSYTPLVYAKKRVCTKCSYEF
jgi:chromosome segregation ATPase